MDQIKEGTQYPHYWRIDTHKSLYGTISPPAEEYYLFLTQIDSIIPADAHYTLMLPENLRNRYQSYVYESIYYLPGRYIHPQYFFGKRKMVNPKRIAYIVTFRCFPNVAGTKILYRDGTGSVLRMGL